MDPFIGTVIQFAGNFAPRGWAFCDGQLLSIASNTALYSVIGTTYGGDGRKTFQLPDLRGRVCLHPGTGPGLPTYQRGEKGGQYQLSLSVNEMPSHTHTGRGAGKLEVFSGTADTLTGKDNVLATPRSEAIYSKNPADGATAADSVKTNLTIANTGGGRAFNSMNPYLGVNFIIALQGMYPARN